MSSPIPLVIPQVLSQPELDDIADYFAQVPRIPRCRNNHFDFVREGKPTLFVKYGDKDIMAEADTQSFFHALSKRDPSAPSIPAVLNAFFAKGHYFLVTEKIDKPTLAECNFIPEEDVVTLVAVAVEWLLKQLPSVPTSVFGRISTTKVGVWHPFFKEHEAPVAFASVDAVNKYVNKAISRLPAPGRPGNVTFPRDDISIFHSDVSKNNFLFDADSGRLWVVDFQYIAVFPTTFQQLGFFNIGSPFAAAVGDRIGIPRSNISNVLTLASIVIGQTGGNASFGLNEFGERK